MPLNESKINDDEQAMLESIRVRQGLQSVEQAFEWLVKTQLREGVKKITGRGRALYAIERKPAA